MSTIQEAIKNRVKELYTLTEHISKSVDNDAKKYSELIKDFSESNDEELKNKLMKEIHGLQLLNTLKTKEVELNIKLINEFYSLSLIFEIDLELSENQKSATEFNHKEMVPTFILNKKGELEFLNPKIKSVYEMLRDNEDITDKEIVEKVTEQVLNNEEQEVK